MVFNQQEMLSFWEDRNNVISKSHERIGIIISKAPKISSGLDGFEYFIRFWRPPTTKVLLCKFLAGRRQFRSFEA